MRTINIDLDRALTGLLNIVQRFGADHTASQSSDGGSGCTYFENRGGALVAVCLVGQYIADLGFLGALAAEDNTPAWGACVFAPDYDRSEESQMWAALEEYGLVFTNEAKFFLYSAQNHQDGGEPWGSAVTKAVQDTHAWLVESLPTHALITKANSGVLPMDPWERELLLG